MPCGRGFIAPHLHHNVLNFLNLLYPKRCLGCGAFGDYICDNCRKSIIFLKDRICPVCTRASIDGLTHPGCRGKYTLDCLFSPFGYQGVIRLALKRLKYQPHLTDIAGLLTLLTADTLKKEKEWVSFIAKKPVIIPVPLHWLRSLSRGYNQTEVLALSLSSRLKLSVNKETLYRQKYTKPQYGLKKDDREKNIQQSFALRSSLPGEIPVLLFDDVWTTGATMRACASVLKRAGVKRVWGLTIAR